MTHTVPRTDDRHGYQQWDDVEWFGYARVRRRGSTFEWVVFSPVGVELGVLPAFVDGKALPARVVTLVAAMWGARP